MFITFAISNSSDFAEKNVVTSKKLPIQDTLKSVGKNYGHLDYIIFNKD